MRDDEWQRWLAREFSNEPDEERRTYPGCLIVVIVCVILWLVLILGAVQLYRRSSTPLPLPPVVHPPLSETRGGTSATGGTFPTGGIYLLGTP